MAAWFTVYCKEPFAPTAAELRTGLDHDDYFILSESYGIDDDDAVERAVRALRVEPQAEPAGVRFAVRYRPPRRRPLLVHVWSEAGRLATEQSEALEQFDKPPPRIKKHLSATREVWAVELGWPQLEDLGVVFAALLSEFVASRAGGLIRDPHDQWWAMKKGRAVRVAR